jgi:hypothetical protein
MLPALAPGSQTDTTQKGRPGLAKYPSLEEWYQSFFSILAQRIYIVYNASVIHEGRHWHPRIRLHCAYPLCTSHVIGEEPEHCPLCTETGGHFGAGTVEFLRKLAARQPTAPLKSYHLTSAVRWAFVNTLLRLSSVGGSLSNRRYRVSLEMEGVAPTMCCQWSWVRTGLGFVGRHDVRNERRPKTIVQHP